MLKPIAPKETPPPTHLGWPLDLSYVNQEVYKRKGGVKGGQTSVHPYPRHPGGSLARKQRLAGLTSWVPCRGNS